VTRNIKLGRREILIVGGAAAVGVAAYGVAALWGVARRCTEFAAASEAAALSARRIGSAYLRMHPEEASEADLLAALAGRPALMRALSAAPDTAAVFRIMDDVVRADFAAGEIAKCHGWILAKSEARACALFALRAAQVD
jgi:hypothetical protein